MKIFSLALSTPQAQREFVHTACAIDSYITAMNWSPNGKYIAAVEKTGPIKTWRISHLFPSTDPDYAVLMIGFFLQAAEATSLLLSKERFIAFRRGHVMIVEKILWQRER